MPSDPEENTKVMDFSKATEHEHSLQSASEASIDSNSLLNSELTVAGRELTPTKRERRKSPATSFGSDNTSTSVQAPMSPNMADLTFEPTIDMMVNDFDDEATLNEEEALADLEAHNPDDEIATLKEESEMPIEELLAKYGGIVGTDRTCSPSSSSRRSGSSRRRRPPQRPHLGAEEAHTACSEAPTNESSQPSESGGDCDDYIDSSIAQQQHHDLDENVLDDFTSASAQFINDGVMMDTEDIPAVLPPQLVPKRHHRSHLRDLYPEESFSESAQALDDLTPFTPLQTLFDEVEIEDEDISETDVSDDDERKTIMVGSDYQAEIPEGLSQYGDILPYENEDQLIWEPSQVSEQEVEDYLAKVQEIRNIVAANEEAEALNDTETVQTPAPASCTTIIFGSNDSDLVVKDNEQALHLLVQCGYDFKEALRRKRLNVLPLSDTMSSWSEDECLKFEEGIKKYGKDFYQIRLNQVRTRTMRELVQFYYLWKKSERRDQSFALNDTIDHMDVFIGERAGNGNGNNSSHSPPPISSNSNGNGDHLHESLAIRKSTSKNYLIMTGNHGVGSITPNSANSRKRKSSLNLEESFPEKPCEKLTDN